jgi:glyoxylase-like metal-dependent hydrolase (beta-lactamase superfamily II)
MIVTALPPLGGWEFKPGVQFDVYIDPTNSYLIETDKKNSAIIDAPFQASAILQILKSRNLTLKKILITHGHFDHVYALKQLAAETGAEVYMHRADKEAIEDLGIVGYEKYDGDLTFVEDGDVIPLDEAAIRVVHVPGHSRGSVCYIAGDALFSGDVLSHNAVGHHVGTYGRDVSVRTESRGDMLLSLKKLAALEGRYTVYPAHWTSTTLDDEKAGNLSFLPHTFVSRTILLG